MANAFDGTEGERAGPEAPLLEIDPELNIFALANGLDLLKNRSGSPDRTLEWYRDGMERRIVILAAGPDRYEVSVEASRRREGVVHRASRSLRGPLTADALREGLRPMLAEGIDAANALEAEDLSAEG